MERSAQQQLTKGNSTRPRRRLALGVALAAMVATTWVVAPPALAVARVSIQSPAPADVVSGIVSIQGSGSTEQGTSDFPVSLSFLIDDNSIGSTQCDETATTCAGSQNWDTSGVSGKHKITVSIATTKGDSASQSETVTVLGEATLELDGPFKGKVGKSVKVTGRATTDQGQVSRTPLSVTIDPALGSSEQRSSKTDTLGHFSFLVPLENNATITVAFADDAAFEGTPATAKAYASVKLTCSFAKSPVAEGAKDSMTCDAGNEPNGAAARLFWQHGPAKGVLGQASGGRAKITFTAKDTTGTGAVKFWMTFEQNSVYGNSRGPDKTLKIH